jgi:hypothetical protein
MASELKFLKGMNKDTGLADQVDGTYRDALNAVVDINKGAISNEFGNKLVQSLPTGFLPVGQIALPNDNFIIFANKVNTSTPSGVITDSTSTIFLIDTSTNILFPLLTTSTTDAAGHLNFDIDNPITGEFRVSPTGEIIIYFTDNKYKFTVEPVTKIEYPEYYNPPRVFNTTRQQIFLSTGGTSNKLYTSTGQNITMLNMFMDSGRIPEFNAASIVEGGGVVTGAYYLAIAYADKDFTETNVLGMANPVYVHPSSESYIPFEMIGGAPGGVETNKSIKWDLTSLNIDYKYVVPYVLQKIGDVQFVYKLEFVEIKTTTLSITYSGLEQVDKATVEDSVLDKVNYLSAKSIAQLDNRMYAANLTGRKDLGFQRFANGIKLQAITKNILEFDPRAYDIYNINVGYAAVSKNVDYPFPTDYNYISAVTYPVQNGKDRGYRNINRLFKEKSYRRGEVYSFYISFIFKDGTESYAYHIPGRNVSQAWENGPLNNADVPGFNPVEFIETNPNGLMYQYLDTSLYVSQSTGYWENRNETYPDSPDFDIYSVDGAGSPVLSGSIRNLNVRHHKMPSNHNLSFSTLVTNIDFSSPPLTNSFVSTSAQTKFNENVRILGFRLENLRIPKFILQQVQGYKVYYAKRNQGDKTIIGQSGLHPSEWIKSGNLFNKRQTAMFGPYYHMWQMGALPNSDSFAYTNYPWASTWNGGNVAAQSVFKFHDFNLLRTQKSLGQATHIDLQYVATMHQWRGRHKGIQPGNIDGEGNFDNNAYYTQFRSGESEYQWINSTLANTDNYDNTSVDSSVYSTPSAFGLLMVAAKYSPPGASGANDYGVSVAGVTGNQSYLGVNQTIFPLDPDSASYLAGMSILKNSSSTAFKGATYLLNLSGESSIVLGLKSGIPPLRGTNIYLLGEDFAFLRKVNLENAQNGPVTTGRPNVYIANLCSTKTDVFEPFDAQRLVWTGFYKSTLLVNITTGGDVDGTNYYTGVRTSDIFGGDIYICRYAYRMTAQRYGFKYFRGEAFYGEEVGFAGGDIDDDNPSDATATTSSYNFNTGQSFITSSGDIIDIENWMGDEENSDWNPHATLHQIIIESEDNINFRYCGDTKKGVSTADSLYFDKYTATDVLWRSPTHDLTKKENLLYEDHYSALQDIRVAIPYPKKDKSTNLFPNRVIRSTIQDGNFIDTYRYFLAIDLKDFGQNKGSITNIFNLNALIYIHTEKSLFKTKGKQNLELADASQAYIGSGDLFAQEPDEFVQSTDGYMGLTNKMGALVTKDGYVFISRNSRKIFLITDKVQDLTDLGLSTWARENVPFALQNYGVSLAGINLDAPTNNFGYLVTYDPLLKRLIITKRDLVPTTLFDTQLAAGDILILGGVVTDKVRKPITLVAGSLLQKSGWTISLSLDTGAWASRHSYIPPLYAFNTKYLYSFNPSTVSKFYVHNDYINPGSFYGAVFNFEFEFISTGDVSTSKTGATSTTKTDNKLYSAVTYFIETYKADVNSIYKVVSTLSPGFTSFYVYTTEQISGVKNLVYLNNIRKVDHNWAFNDFRDLSKINFNTTLVSTPNQINVQNDAYTGTYAPGGISTMFTSEGVINPLYLDTAKPWYEQRKFIDKFLGIRLISNNRAQNLINLYTAKASYRSSSR